MNKGLRRAAGFVLALTLSACGAAPTNGHPGHGVVKDIDETARTITLDHDDIPGLMKSMTMDFELAPSVALEGIDVGSQVDFRVKEERGSYVVTEIRPSGP